ncbi:MAG: DNA mismatch repair protein MutS, partial [Treponema sp.]|nr:DNA mismatch repair protein MutS [Treponema sp.]
MLREWLMFPLTDLKRILSRQNHVELFATDRSLLKKFRMQIEGILDIERLAGRIAMDKAHAKDLQALRHSLELWLLAQQTLGSFNFASLDTAPAQKIVELIASSILDDPSTILTEGRIIREGWSQELDHWRHVQTDFTRILEEYIEEERQNTGIPNLRIKKTNNAGFCIEVTKGKLSMVPAHFIIRRSMVNADRYTTVKLQELETSLNESGTKVLELERDLFLEVRNSLKEYIPYLQQMAAEIAYADVCASFSQAACTHDWVRPSVDESLAFEVKNGRHPVVEQHLPSGEFVPNDLSLAGEKNTCSFALITGPNMAGKSTFLRQNALIALLAQTGSFVPCQSARIGIVDRIFCRVGASDNLARGESTFLVEMTETAHILRSATERSLVIMDEVGRGTSTEDGLSIAWSVSEYLLNRIRCKTLFATHYHELTRMEHPKLQKLCMAVDEEGPEIVFLRKVIEGNSRNSYGIHVASLAGIPEPVIERAKSILERIQGEASDQPIVCATKDDDKTSAEKSLQETIVRKSPAQAAPEKHESLTGALFSDEELILDEILSLDVDNLTPIAALQNLARWKKTLSGR